MLKARLDGLEKVIKATPIGQLLLFLVTIMTNHKFCSLPLATGLLSRVTSTTITATKVQYPSRPIPSYPIPSYHIPSHPIPSHPIPSNPIKSHPILSHPITSHPIASHPIPSHQIPYVFISYLICFRLQIFSVTCELQRTQEVKSLFLFQLYCPQYHN
jgi:hypothetical protein